jgi:outer membrane protein TolC
MKDPRSIVAMLALVLVAGWLRPPTAVGQVEQRQWHATGTGRAAPPEPTTNADGSPPASNSAETLEDAWRIALQNDDRVKAGSWNISAADQARAAACAEGCPSLNVGANLLAISDQISIVSPVGDVPMFAQGSAGFHAIVTQPIYTAGKIDSQVAAAGAEVTANRAEAERTKLDVKMNVAELYVAVLRGRRVVEVAKSKVASLRAHAQDVDNRFQADKASRNEVLAVQVALADARQQELRAANTLEMTNAAFNRALGRSMTEAVNIVDLKEDGEPAPVDDLVREAWERRPELRELSARAAALRERAAAACSENSPQVTLRGGYVYQSDTYLQPNGVAGVALTAEWNLFDSGRAEHKATALSQQAEAAVRLRRDAESTIALEIRQRWLEFQTAKQQIAFARVAVAQADENLRVVRDRYVQQLGNNTEVLDAETMRAQAYMNWYNSVYEAALVRLRLRRAAGEL